MKLIVFATRKMGYKGLQRFVSDGLIIQAVFTKDYDITESYDSTVYTEFCRRHKIPIHVTDKVHHQKHIDFVGSLSPDLGVSLYWRRLLREPLISIPKYGFINTHASRLPKYRGFAATSWAILLGDKEIGLTVHQVNDETADDGDIFAQETITIDSSTTIRSLFNIINKKAVKLNCRVIKKIDNGSISPIAQSRDDIVHAYPRLPVDGKIDWNRSALEIDRLIRAVTRPYPGAFTYISDQGLYKKLYIWKASVVEKNLPFVGIPGHVVKNDPEKNESWVLTGDGILALTEVQIEGRQPFSPGSVWNSLQMRLGIIPEEAILHLQNLILKTNE